MIAVSLVACTLALPTLVSAEEMMMPKYDYSSVQTMTKDGLELVPLRQIAESLGFKVIWNGENRSITLLKLAMMDDKSMTNDKMMEDKTMSDKNMMEKKMDMYPEYIIQIDSKNIRVGGMEEMLMVAPTILNEMTYISKEFVDTYLVKEMMMK